MRSVSVFTCDVFGEAVATHLGRWHTFASHVGVDGMDALPQGEASEIWVVGGMHLEDHLLLALENRAFSHDVQLIPFRMQGLWMCIGPVIGRGRSACCHCARVRSEQNSSATHERVQEGSDRGSQVELVLSQSASAPIAQLTAAQLGRLLSSCESEEPHLDGAVWQIHVGTYIVQNSIVIGVHGCSRCGEHRSWDTLGSTALQNVCQRLWAVPDPE